MSAVKTSLQLQSVRPAVLNSVNIVAKLKQNNALHALRVATMTKTPIGFEE